MTAPTLGDLYRSQAVDHPLEFAVLCEEFLRANREWLERCEWERQVRASVDCDGTVPILLAPKSLTHHPIVVTDRFEGGGPLRTVIIVGADWKPEVAKCRKCDHPWSEHVAGHGCTARVGGPECECGERAL